MQNKKLKYEQTWDSQAPVGYNRCLIVEYDLFNATTFIKNLTYVRFGINFTQFYVNFSRQEHKIDVL